MLKVRLTTLEDVERCVALSRDACLLTDSLMRQRVNQWCEWLRRGGATSAVVVDEDDTLYAFGLTVAVSDNFVASVRTSNTSLALNSVHYASVVWGPDLVKAHRGEGINLIGFYGWREDGEPSLLDQARWLLLRSFLHLHRGLHLKSFTKEVFGEEELSGYVDMGCQVYRAPNEYPLRLRGWKPALVGLDRAQVKQRPRWATLLFQLFEREAPRLHLRSDRLLLVQLAYHLRLSNEQIADWLSRMDRFRGNHYRGGALHHAVRRRWSRIYAACDRVYGTRWRRGNHSHWYDFLELVEHYPEIAFPLQIGRLASCSPELARQCPLPVEPG